MMEGHSVAGHWIKGDLCYKVAKNLAELYSHSSVLWKVKLMSNEIRYLSKKISKQKIEGAACCLVTAHSKIQKDRDELKKELLRGVNEGD
jgi:hypothetical protein